MHDPRAFAEEWIASWNAHDVERVLLHYASDIVFLSPIAQQRLGHGRVVGTEALRNYWVRALADLPDLRFEMIDLLVGHECLTILYRNERGRRAAESFEFGPDCKVIRSCACYA